MKNLAITLILTITCFVSISQVVIKKIDMPIDPSTGKITYKNMINTEYTIDENISNIEKLISKNENISSLIDSVINLHVDTNRIVLEYTGELPVTYNKKKSLTSDNTAGMFMKSKDEPWGYVQFDISFLLIEGKLGYKFTNFYHKHDTEYDCGALEQKVTPYALERYWWQYKEQADLYVKNIIREIELITQNKDLGEEW